MSHSHRDDQNLVDLPVSAPATVVTPSATPAVANGEAARRARERRTLEHTAEQTLEHQFAGDLRQPDVGGTDTELRRVMGTRGEEADEDDASRSATTRRGPPAPRFEQVALDALWTTGSFYNVLPTSTATVWTCDRAPAAVMLPPGTTRWRT